MKIAVNTRFLLSHKMEGFGWYTYEIVKRLVENHPEHEFILFFDRPYDKKFIFGENVTPVVLKPQARHPFLFYVWFEFSVTRALKKYKADIFFSPDGYLSLRTDVPQVATIHDLNFEHNPQDLAKAHLKYYKKYFPQFAQKADRILTVSEYSKKDIVQAYGVNENKIDAIWNGASDVFQPILDEKDLHTIKCNYTNGLPYFLFVGALHPRKNVRRLIEAFEIFKQRNPDSKQQLVIVGTELWNKSAADIKIKDSTKYAIHFTGHVDLEQLAQLMAAADIFTFVPYFEGFGIPLVEAMKCGTPVLAGNKTSLPEVAGDAAVFCDPFDVSDIASKLEMLCFDKTLQSNLSKKGLERSKLFSWDISAEKVWDSIEKVLKN